MKTQHVLGVAMSLSLLLIAGETVRSQNEQPKPQKAAKAPAQGADSTKPAAAKPQGRLPQYYGQIGLADAQRNQIYAVQTKYRTQLEELEKRLEALREKRDKEIQSVLSAEQKLRLDELIANAKSRAKARASNNAPAESETER